MPSFQLILINIIINKKYNVLSIRQIKLKIFRSSTCFR